LFLMLLLLAPLASPARADALSPARQREILRAALSAYDQAVSVALEDPVQARAQYRKAAAGFSALQDAGLNNPGLDYNLGNVYFRLGELGRAIRHYRRAERSAPNDPALVANLRYARDRVEPQIAPSGERRLARQLLFWHYATSAAQRFWALAVFSVVGWLLMIVWLVWRRRPLAVLGLVCVVFALAAGGSLLWQIYDQTRYPHAVIVGAETLLRLGRGENTDLALKQPLGPGVEFRIIDRRGDWVEVRLANGQTGWLPAERVSRI
jgi:tetratricopeptide (TPR) repeat protein